MSARASAVVWLALAASGCGDDDGPSGEVDARVGLDGATPDAAMPDEDASVMRDAGPPPDDGAIPELDGRVDDMAVPPDEDAMVPASGWRSETALPVDWQEISAGVVGNEIWVVGGFEGTRTVAAVRVYDITAGTWRDGPDLPSARHHVMVTVVGNDLYALGGETGLTFTPIASAAVLRDGASEWEAIEDLPEARGAGVATVIDGRIVLAGGVGAGNDLVGPVDFYDPAMGAWSTTRGAAIPTLREHTAGFAYGGRLWVVGGRMLSLTTNTSVVEIYDPAMDRWEPGPSLIQERGGFGAAVVGDRAYVVGGEQPDRALDEVETIDLTTMLEWTSAPPVPTPRHGHAVVGAAGRLWVIGGANRPIFAPVDAVESYAP